MTLTLPSDFNPRTDPPLDFPDRDFGNLTAGDYATLGFLSGLEVHQQLLTKSKLFCRCPARQYVDSHDAEVLRHMRPTLSELGEYDGTALMEFKTKKEIIYRLSRKTVCTYEIDDTPPFEIDDEAILIAVEQSQLLNLQLVAELHVMRKQYLDGSIPTGFQRTAMIGLGGTIPFREPSLGVDRELRIRQLSLEEDSCREVSDIGHRIVFKTDRLGMPLTEAVTEPDLLTPLEVQAAARLLADVARATGKVRRGAGAARQDVNVSVAGGRRVEIKGVFHHIGLPRLVHIETYRQLNLLRIREALLARGVTAEALAIADEGLPWDVSELVANVTGDDAVHGIRVAVHRMEPGDAIVAVKLPGFANLLSHRTQPGLDFAHELRERVRVIACPVGWPFMVHTDQEGSDSVVRWRDVREMLRAGSDDAVVIFWMPQADAATAAREVLGRAMEALVGVPSETRQAHRDGTTGFERILPGPDRMYPDTDTPPQPIPDAVIERIRLALPERPWEREARYESFGLSRNEAQWVARAWWGPLFDALVESAPGWERRLAFALGQRLPFHGRRDASADALRPLVVAISSGQVRPEALCRMIDTVLRLPERHAGDVVTQFATEESVDPVVAEVVEQARGMNDRSTATLVRWGMGVAMRRLIGRADPCTVREKLRQALGVSAEAAS